jgi:cytochrome b
MNAASATSARATAPVVVWDPIVRVGHWALVVAFAITYFSAEEEGGMTEPLHVWGGYIVGAIVVLRVLWGLVGPKYARFSDFVCGPIAAIKYLVDIIAGHARRYLGHSPAGAAMVIALLICLAGTAATGVLAYGERGKRPLAVNGVVVTAVARADENESGAREAEGAEGGKSIISEVHGALANITLALVILHVLGVALASYAHRENLVAAMLTGKKRAAE